MNRMPTGILGPPEVTLSVLEALKYSEISNIEFFQLLDYLLLLRDISFLASWYRKYKNTITIYCFNTHHFTWFMLFPM